MMVVDDRAWVTVPMSPDMKERIEKAAARNEMPRAEYLRIAIRSYMEDTNEWSLRGPKKGQG
jgi:predicted DNA-binding protein